METGGEMGINGDDLYNVKEYGAVGDGVTLDTPAIQAAIDACGINDGGTVVIPKCVFRTGIIRCATSFDL